MNSDDGLEILRATIFHTPKNPFDGAEGMVCFEDGGLAVHQGKVAGCGDYADISSAHPEASVRDLRGGFLLPGLIDTHVHYPQARILGGLGYSLLDWLTELTLPEEARLADAGYARIVAREFVHGLVSHGTTTALAFGAHFLAATAALFQTAEEVGIRLFSGLVLSDRGLLPELHQTPAAAYRDSRELIERFHGRGRLGYAVMPRFALSTSGPMLEICQALLHEYPSIRFTTHINESVKEVEEVRRIFPWASDYLSVYERFGLMSQRSVLAHNIHAGDPELIRLARSHASVAHCPSSNAALGSGIFSMRRHLDAGVHFALGTDVGAGSGFGVLKETLQAYLLQRVAPEPVSLTSGQMLYLSTSAGAQALGLEDDTGDFGLGKSADFLYLCPPEGSVLSSLVKHADTPERILSTLFTLAGSESVREVRVGGDVVFTQPATR